MNLSPLPTWNKSEKSLSSGMFFKQPSVCCKANFDKCNWFYSSIEEKRGFHICPCGLTAYSTGLFNNPIFSGIRVSGHYDVKKTKSLKSDFLPTLPEALVVDSVSKYLVEGVNEIIDIDLVNSSLHEIRKFNLEIKRVAEELLGMPETGKTEICKKVKSIFAASSLISVRLNVYDFEENPQIITASTPYNVQLYKKFDKANHILEVYARDNRVRVKLCGNSYITIEAYPVLDFLPFVILENAIKYSPSDQDVMVQFDEYGSSLDVTIRSIGPALSKTEMQQVFDKGSRGKTAKSIDSSGGGYGLYFAKVICDLHNIDISAKVGKTRFTLNGVTYKDFEILLHYSS